MIRYIFYLLFVILFGCRGTRTNHYYENFEPHVLQKKGDIYLSAGLRTPDQLKLSGSVATNDWFTIRAGYSGSVGLRNFNFAGIFSKDLQSHYLFIAPTFNYQSNVNYKNYNSNWGRFNYKFDCEYFIPGFVFGVDFKTYKIDHQICAEVNRNIVGHYTVQFGPKEPLINYLPDFNSAALTYSFLWSVNEIFILKMQAGLAYRERKKIASLLSGEDVKHPTGPYSIVNVGIIAKIPKGKYTFAGWMKEAFK